MFAFFAVLALSASHPAPRAPVRAYDAHVDQRLHAVFGKLGTSRPAPARQARTPRAPLR
jgi:hypothetical protein